MYTKRFYFLLLGICLSSHVLLAQTDTAHSYIKIEGELAKPLTLTAADLAKMTKTTATMKDRDNREYTYKGVPVASLLSLAGVTMGKELRGENLAKYLLVKCADGYEVVFSLAELDSSFTDKAVILADEMDGKPLPAGKGPFRLVAPGEKKPARSCFQVTAFVIRFAKE